MSGTEQAAIEISDAAAAVGGRTIWAGVDVRVDPGDFVAVLGPNGVGKSTLVKAILGLTPLSAGAVRVFGRTPSDGRHLVGYLPQRRTFDPELRVRGVDIVRLGIDGARWGLPWPGADRYTARGRESRRRVHEVIERVGAAPFALRPIGQLSGGEQQRLLIAQALVGRPRVLLLDEPLDSLDLPNQASVAGLISGICRDEGVAVLMVAHDVNPILSYLDRVIYLAGGRAVSGPVRQVITGEILSGLYGTPIEVLEASDGRLIVVGSPESASFHSDRHDH